uniref:Ovule protein n=1 Tax=Caenorhabditis tropicalis TaxID=1561998 RepID=A0A1I7T0E1_9PELO
MVNALLFPKRNHFPGQIVNLPPNLQRAQFPPNPASNQYFAQRAQPYPQHSANSFSVCYSLSDDRNSPARQFFDRFQHHPMLPENMTPKKIVFVYERPDIPKAPPQQNVVHHVFHYNNQPRGGVDAAVGDYSVVRKNMETQTEWSEVEQAADNRPTLHNTITLSNTKAPPSNLSEPGIQEVNTAFMKVAKWLQMCQKMQASQEEPPITVHQQHMINQGRLQPHPASIQTTTQFHGSHSSVGAFKKQADVPSSTIVRKRHSSTNEHKIKAAADVVGDDNEKKNEVMRDSETSVVGEKSATVAEEASNDAQEADVSAHVPSHKGTCTFRRV